MLDPDANSLRVGQFGMLMACFGAACASLGVLTLVVLAAAKSICVCVLAENRKK
jgi:hypothetical protein